MDAFNPWDLVKNVGRGFKWLVVGRRKRLDDISYKNSALGAGLEPTRNQLTAFDTGDQSLDEGPRPYVGGGKPSRYQPLHHDNDDDRDNLVTNAQPFSQEAPLHSYPRPMDRLPQGAAPGVYDPPPPPRPTPGSHQPPRNNLPYPTHDDGRQETGIIDPMSTQSLSTQDTSYHGAAAAGPRRNITPTAIPPDPHPLGPPGRASFEAATWAEEGEGRSERDLGGGHGVGDNRF